MKTVRIVKSWYSPDIMRQTPKSSGLWDNIKFTDAEIEECDYVIVSNYPSRDVRVKCYPENIWCVLQEPPNEYFKYFHNADKVYTQVFMQDLSLRENRFIHTQPALPWHIDKSYDQLKREKYLRKQKKLSCISSDKTEFRGQWERLNFIRGIRNEVDFDLFGKGLNYIKDKWEALAPYRYSLIIENYRVPHYWSEKLADCFLAFTMPIYYGCTNISDYFPNESMAVIDINEKGVDRKIKEITESNLWKKNHEAVSFSRDLILNKYQFFPFMAGFIKKWELKEKEKRKSWITLRNETSLIKNALRKFKRMMK